MWVPELQVHAAFALHLPDVDMSVYHEFQNSAALYKRCWTKLALTRNERNGEEAVLGLNMRSRRQHFSREIHGWYADNGFVFQKGKTLLELWASINQAMMLRRNCR